MRKYRKETCWWDRSQSQIYILQICFIFNPKTFECQITNLSLNLFPVFLWLHKVCYAFSKGKFQSKIFAADSLLCRRWVLLFCAKLQILEIFCAKLQEWHIKQLALYETCAIHKKRHFSKVIDLPVTRFWRRRQGWSVWYCHYVCLNSDHDFCWLLSQ